MAALKAFLFAISVSPSAAGLLDSFIPKSQKCTGTSCCASSWCFNFPMLGCKASRGTTECIGSAMYRLQKGVCACKNATTGPVACSYTGTCPATAGSTLYQLPSQSLYEVDDGENMEPIASEGVNPVRVLLATMGVGMIITGLAMIACGRKQSGQARQTSRASRPSNPEAEEEQLVE